MGHYEPGDLLFLRNATQLKICGADDKNPSGLFKKTSKGAYFYPGEHVVYVRVDGGTAGYLKESLYDKDVRITLEAGRGYTMGFPGWDFWINDSSGRVISLETLS